MSQPSGRSQRAPRDAGHVSNKHSAMTLSNTVRNPRNVYVGRGTIPNAHAK